jgi:predicted porin
MKHIAAFALLAVAAASASAQSTVTLFGVVDVAARHVKNGDHSLRSLTGNGLNSSRLGFRGVEDLGGGLKAGFWLEHGFNADSGTQSDAARFWNRRSTVSLSGNFGEIRLGRDFTPTFSGFADYDVFGTNGVGDASKFNSMLGTNADTATRSDNEVTYFLPGNLGGFRGQVSFAPSENVAGKKYIGGRVAYGAGPLDVSLAYGQTTVTPALGEDKLKSVVLGASYDFGVVKLTGYVQRNEFANQELDLANIGVQVPLGQGILRASYVRADASGRNTAGASVENNDANQFAVGYVYNLSKRTALYTTVARVNNKGTASFVVPGGVALPSPNNGKDSTGVDFGLRHSF